MDMAERKASQRHEVTQLDVYLSRAELRTGRGS
jgi:hypothetical protein